MAGSYDAGNLNIFNQIDIKGEAVFSLVDDVVNRTILSFVVVYLSDCLVCIVLCSLLVC